VLRCKNDESEHHHQDYQVNGFFSRHGLLGEPNTCVGFESDASDASLVRLQLSCLRTALPSRLTKGLIEFTRFARSYVECLCGPVEFLLLPGSVLHRGIRREEVARAFAGSVLWSRVRLGTWLIHKASWTIQSFCRTDPELR